MSLVDLSKRLAVSTGELLKALFMKVRFAMFVKPPG